MTLLFVFLCRFYTIWRNSTSFKQWPQTIWASCGGGSRAARKGSGGVRTMYRWPFGPPGPDRPEPELARARSDRAWPGTTRLSGRAVPPIVPHPGPKHEPTGPFMCRVSPKSTRFSRAPCRPPPARSRHPTTACACRSHRARRPPPAHVDDAAPADRGHICWPHLPTPRPPTACPRLPCRRRCACRAPPALLTSCLPAARPTP